MGLKGKKSKVEYFLCKNVPVGYKIDHKPCTNISSATYRIPKGLQGHYPPERRIKKIYDAGNKLSHLEVGKTTALLK